MERSGRWVFTAAKNMNRTASKMWTKNQVRRSPLQTANGSDPDRYISFSVAGAPHAYATKRASANPAPARSWESRGCGGMTPYCSPRKFFGRGYFCRQAFAVIVEYNLFLTFCLRPPMARLATSSRGGSQADRARGGRVFALVENHSFPTCRRVKGEEERSGDSAGWALHSPRRARRHAL